MKKNPGQTTGLFSHRAKRLWAEFLTAGLVYAGLSFFLYYPHLRDFSPVELLIAFNASAAALGCCVLSSRWINALPGRLFAGLLYGFGAFTLGFGIYHSCAGLLVAAMPWLFYPSAFWPGRPGRLRLIIRSVFFLLPFAAIVFFFGLASKQGLFPIPVQAKLHLTDLTGLITPLTVEANKFPFISFYHAPVAAVIMGLFMLIRIRRLAVTFVLIAGLVLAFCEPVFGVSPIIWTALPVLCFAILAGAGLQGLVWSTAADKKYVLICGLIMAALTIFTSAMAMKGSNIFFNIAVMYAMATLAVAIIFFITSAKLRLHWLRWTILCSAAGIDIFISAPIIIDKIF